MIKYKSKILLSAINAVFFAVVFMVQPCLAFAQNDSKRVPASAAAFENECQIMVSDFKLASIYKTRNYNPKTDSLDMMTVEAPMQANFNTYDLGQQSKPAMMKVSFSANFNDQICPEAKQNFTIHLIVTQQEKDKSHNESEIHVNKNLVESSSIGSYKLSATIPANADKAKVETQIPFAKAIHSRKVKKQLHSLIIQLKTSNGKIIHTHTLIAHMH